MKRRLVWMAVALLAIAVVAGGLRALAARKAREAVPAPAAETAFVLGPQETVRVAERELPQALPVSGTLRAVDSAVVKARVAGEIQGLAVREGDTVRAGQVIARIDPEEYRSRARQAQEQADSARAQAEVAQRTFDNNQALVDQGFISRTALDTSRSNLNAARASHRAALAMVEVAQKSLAETVLRSPIDGQVAQRLVQPGERVAVDTRVVEVVDLRRLELEATLAAADSVAVRVGQRASLQIEGLGPERTLGAEVARINPSAQPASRSVMVYLRLDGAEGLRQGLFAQGSLETGRSRTLVLPLSAVRVDKPAPYVQVVADGRVVHREVALGARAPVDGTVLVAVRGLPEGTLAVAGSVGTLRDGTPVRVATPAPAPAATPGRPATP